MTIEKIKIPDLGDALDVEVIEICVKPGDMVTKDDSIIVLESEKAAMEIPASVTGKVIDIKVNNGDTVNEGIIFLEIEAEESETKEVIEEASEDTKELEKSAPKIEEQAVPAASIDTSSSINYTGSIYAGPAVRKLAREFGINLNEVTPSGPRGRILKEDLHHFVKQRLSSSIQNFSKNPTVDFAKWGEINTEPLTKFQKTAAENLQQSWQNIPHVTQHDEANIDELMLLRTELNKASGLKISPLAFFVKAVAKLLEEFPLMNASLDENTENVVLKNYINIGIAIDTPKGLIVPNIKDANKLSITEISNEIGRMATAAKDRKLKVDELKGSTFSVSSLGAIGGKFFTPIINPPEVGILGISKTFKSLELMNGDIKEISMLPISLSYDHRLINGVEAVKFTSRFCEMMKDSEFYKLNY
jgi:pyruvate dehydrogenase E2 component (dihydrolipoamide acetyltransferase)